MDEDIMRGYFYELVVIQEKAMIEALSTFPLDGTVKGLILSAKAWERNVTRLEAQFMKKNDLTLKDLARIKVIGELFNWPTPDSELSEACPAIKDSYVQL
ncbi:MAG TPA: hypothetical protein PLI88_01680 [Bacillota bacterium]|nr:hypothetical protein [Bacillota bacterium]HOH09561.1 hypothetical protein [Bacillota bacterium]HOY88305.1 hypothetical protein [Bacillota bacterium]HPI00844.1 hypothetical protein [Bacillota bacterium]HPM63453.1 hypothetical protein [Bacillota bacterium]